MPSLLLLTVILGPLFAYLLYLDQCLANIGSLPKPVPLKEIENDCNGVGNIVVDAPRANTSAAPNRAYLIIGDSSFLSSWIARYLIIRGERIIHVASRVAPPHDVTRHGAVLHRIDPTSLEADALAKILKNIMTQCDAASTRLVVYFCAVHIESHLAANSAKCLADTFADKDFLFNRPTVVFCGTTTAKPVHWFKPWTRSNWVQVTSPDKLSHPTPVESILFESGECASASIRLDGFLSGHLDDPFLTAALKYQGGLNHSGQVPLSIIHVEDVVRALLLLESHLLGNDNYLHKVYTISSREMTCLDLIYTFCSTNTEFRAIRVQPVVALLMSTLVSIFRPRRYVFNLDGKQTQSPLLITGITSLTMDRFDELQVCRVPNPSNDERAKIELGFEPRFSISDAIGTTVHEHTIRKRREAT